MKTTLFARPNLKLFLCFALGLALFQHLIMAGDAPDLLVADLRTVSPGTIDQLLSRAVDRPTIANCMLVSEYYRQLGDPGRAMSYLRKASLLAELDGE